MRMQISSLKYSEAQEPEAVQEAAAVQSMIRYQLRVSNITSLYTLITGRKRM